MILRSPLLPSAAILYGVLALVAIDCKKTQPPKPPPEPLFVPDMTPDIRAICDKLLDAGCPEGKAVSPAESCYEHLARENSLAPLPQTACILDAGSKAAVRACGDPKTTITFRCPEQPPASSLQPPAQTGKR